jgi:RNA polymerase-binding transcription factor DksA
LSGFEIALAEFGLGVVFSGGAAWLIASTRSRRKKPQAVRSGLVMEPEKPSLHLEAIRNSPSLDIAMVIPADLTCPRDGLVFNTREQLREHFDYTRHDKPISVGDTIHEQEKLTLRELDQISPDAGVRSRAYVICSDCGEPIVDETLGSFMGGTRWVHAKHIQHAAKKKSPSWEQ